jgi:(1->4)-alpha-D-glucan 1-alpha-D-glucosylmutase
VFAHGDYQPLEISGSHRDHVIAFARRRGRDAAITAVAKSFAVFSQSGRIWPHREAFDGALSVKNYSVAGIGSKTNATELRLSALFQHLPAVVLKARFKGALKPARRHLRA